MTIYLYVKTHRKTGLKYLGKTARKDPNKYRGSGKYWKRHIREHGYDVETEILRECQTNEEVRQWGLYYSELWDVVNSKDEHGKKTWANLKEEAGDGLTSEQSRQTQRKRVSDGTHHFLGDELHRQRVANGTHHLLGGEIQRQTHRKRIEDGTHHLLGGEIQGKLSRIRVENRTHNFLNPTQWTCPQCCKSGRGIGTFTRWHGNNCKNKCSTI